MAKKKEKFLDRIVKKNYNNQLELVLENKSFDENTKSILLSMMYKLESAYNDYELVKTNVMPKDEYLQMIIGVIEKDVDTIKIAKIKSKEPEVNQLKVDKDKKEIICYPIERNLLYCLSDISKKEKIIKDKYYIIDRILSDLLLIGNNINAVEPIRDFNGFAWDVVAKDIESLEYNLIYQNLRILVGAKFLNKWIYNKEIMLDYFDIFKNKLEDLYGKQIQENLLKCLVKISILLEEKYNAEHIQNLKKDKIEIENQLKQLNNKAEFIKKLTKEKKDLNKQIKDIDTIINDKSMLQNEYNARNKKLPLDKKIFSMRILAKILVEEREELEEKRKKINKMLNPKYFVKYKNKLEEKNKILNYLGIINIEEQINEELLKIQNLFLECLKIKIEKSKSKKEIVNLLIELRYYLSIPFSKSKKIIQNSKLKNTITQITQMLINKAVQEKVLINILNDANINYLVLKEILTTKIIDLQSIYINFTKEDEKLILQIYDDNVFEKKVDLGELSTFDLKEFSVKFNKNIKIFTLN